LRQTVLLRLEAIEPNRKQSRTAFDPDKLEELANSIKEQGVLQPILVRRTARGTYEIIAGERRVRACKMVGLKEIPAIVRDSDDTNMMINSFLENAQREDLTPSEKENALIGLWRTGNFETPRDLDKSLGYQSGYCGSIIEAREFREKYEIPITISTSTIVSTKGLENGLRQRVLLKVGTDEGRFGQVRTVREIKAIVERAPAILVDKVLENEISLEEAKRTIELYEQALAKDSMKPLASALAEGNVSPTIAEKTIRLYDRLEREGVSLDREVVLGDVEELKRQSIIDAAHDKLMEEARIAVLTGRKKSIDFQIQDPGNGFVREVTDVASKVQRWGIPTLMTLGGSRWKVAIKYFQEIDSKMHFLLGYKDES